MKRNGKQELCTGLLLLAGFALWTGLIQRVDVQPVGLGGTEVGFASLNLRFHELTGVHMTLYTVTDWLGLAPVFLCLVFAGLGFAQLVKRRSLFKVDPDILLLGVYYILVILGYLIFEMIPINFRPVLIEGRMEASYPSSTTLLVLSVMPAVCFQAKRRIKNGSMKRGAVTASVLFTLFMVFGRTVAGVHWLTDIIGSVILSAGLYLTYRAGVDLFEHKTMAEREAIPWNLARSCRNCEKAED